MKNTLAHNFIENTELEDVINSRLSLKAFGMKFPKEEELYTKEIKFISAYLNGTKFPFNKVYHAKRIAERNAFTAGTEAASLFMLFEPHKKANSILLKKFGEFNKNGQIVLSEGLKGHSTGIYYDSKNGKPCISQIEVAPLESSVQSISLARTVIEAIKNENPREFSKMWKYNYVIPFFLEEYFARHLSKDSSNEDLLDAMRFLRMWSVQTNNLYYMEIKKAIERDPYGVDAYKAKMQMITLVYPNLKGYVDALKLLEKTEKTNPKFILEEIKKVILQRKTTEQLLNEMKVSEIDSREVLEKRCKKLRIK